MNGRFFGWGYSGFLNPLYEPGMSHTVAHFDRNHWVPEDPSKAIELFFANEYRARNSNARVRLLIWDLPLTHYAHVEMPKQLAAAHYSVIRWFFK